MIRRGDIWWVDIGKPVGSGPGHRRPVLVVSADAYNRSRIGTVVAVAISSNLRLVDAPGNVRLPTTDSGLSEDSVANVSQIVTLDKDRLTDWVGPIDSGLLELVEAGLRQVLAL